MRLSGPRGSQSWHSWPRSIGPQSRAECLEACEVGTPQAQHADSEAQYKSHTGTLSVRDFLLNKAPCPSQEAWSMMMYTKVVIECLMIYTGITTVAETFLGDDHDHIQALQSSSVFHDTSWKRSDEHTDSGQQ